MVPEMALPSGSTDNGASHIRVRHTGATVAQVVGLIVVSLLVLVVPVVPLCLSVYPPVLDGFLRFLRHL
jgi:hypothetical protein